MNWGPGLSLSADKRALDDTLLLRDALKPQSREQTAAQAWGTCFLTSPGGRAPSFSLDDLFSREGSSGGGQRPSFVAAPGGSAPTLQCAGRGPEGPPQLPPSTDAAFLCLSAWTAHTYGGAWSLWGLLLSSSAGTPQAHCVAGLALDSCLSLPASGSTGTCHTPGLGGLSHTVPWSTCPSRPHRSADTALSLRGTSAAEGGLRSWGAAPCESSPTGRACAVPRAQARLTSSQDYQSGQGSSCRGSSHPAPQLTLRGDSQEHPNGHGMLARKAPSSAQGTHMVTGGGVLQECCEPQGLHRGALLPLGGLAEAQTVGLWGGGWRDPGPSQALPSCPAASHQVHPGSCRSRSAAPKPHFKQRWRPICWPSGVQRRDENKSLKAGTASTPL